MVHISIRRRLAGASLPALLLLGAISAKAADVAVPDISGPWEIDGDATRLHTADGKPPPLLPAMQAVYVRHQAAAKAGDKSYDPINKCVPPGVPRLMLQKFPFNIVQGKTMYGFIFEWNHLNRVIYMNQSHFEPINLLYLGQSVGHWEGKALIIDTNNYNDMTLLDDTGLPHTDALHTVERIRLVDGGKRLEDRIHIEDPGAYVKPWDAVLTFGRHPHAIIEEDYCLGRTGQGTLKQQ